MSARARVPRAMTIAGSDSGGGAGIQADLKTFAAFGVYGTSVIVAVTAQNTRRVAAVHEVPPGVVISQMEAVISDIGADAAKTGMLGSRRMVEAVAATVKRLKIPNLVVDPVMVSKAGAPLLESDALEPLRLHLLPAALMVTPNLPEAEMLVGGRIRGLEAARRAAREIHRMGPRIVVIKGGHGEGDPVDLLFDGDSFLEFRGPRIRSRSDHGTGCTFSAAVTALLARGEEVRAAVGEAKQFVEGAIRAASPVGSGHGPVDHFFRLRR